MHGGRRFVKAFESIYLVDTQFEQHALGLKKIEEADTSGCVGGEGSVACDLGLRHQTVGEQPEIPALQTYAVLELLDSGTNLCLEGALLLVQSSPLYFTLLSLSVQPASPEGHADACTDGNRIPSVRVHRRCVFRDVRVRQLQRDVGVEVLPGETNSLVCSCASALQHVKLRPLRHRSFVGSGEVDEFEIHRTLKSKGVHDQSRLVQGSRQTTSPLMPAGTQYQFTLAESVVLELCAKHGLLRTSSDFIFGGGRFLETSDLVLELDQHTELLLKRVEVRVRQTYFEQKVLADSLCFEVSSSGPEVGDVST